LLHVYGDDYQYGGVIFRVAFILMLAVLATTGEIKLSLDTSKKGLQFVFAPKIIASGDFIPTGLDTYQPHVTFSL
jgi:hypothetical protein